MPRPKKQHLKQRADGRYCCKYKGHQFFGRTEEEALAAREEYKNRPAGKAAPVPLLGDYISWWLPVYKGSVKPNTYNSYVSILDKVASPLSLLPLDAITSDNIAEIYASLDGRSASYIHKAAILLNAIFDSAVDAGHIAKNPCAAKSVKPPRGTRGTHRAITREERLLIFSTPHRMQLPALIMLYCGLRRGEVLALDAADISSSVTVRQAVYFLGNRPQLSTPKTASGIRSVPVPDILRPFLKDLHGLVAPGLDGAYMTEQAFKRSWESYLKALTQAAGHPVAIRPHDLRHTYCTMLRDAGVDIHQAIIWMGHADEKMILRIYDHPDASREAASTSLINQAFTL